MNRDEEITLLRKRQCKSIRKRSLLSNALDGILSATLMLITIGVVYAGYSYLEYFMRISGE